MKSSSKTISIPFRTVVFTTNQSTSLTGGASELDIVPANLGSRIADMAVDWQKYRVTKLHVALKTLALAVRDGTGGYEVGLALAYDPNPSSLSGASGGFAAMSQFQNYVFGKDDISLPLNSSDLIAPVPVKWFDTTATGTPSDSFRYQGTLYYLVYRPTLESTWNTCIELSGVCEFSVPADPTDSVALQQRIERDRRKLADLKEQTLDDDYGSVVDLAGPDNQVRSAPSVSGLPPTARSGASCPPSRLEPVLPRINFPRKLR
jgi:hypothetical protein